MLKKHMAACLVATALAATPAFAQSTAPGPSGATDRPAASGSGAPTSGSPAMAPGAGAPATGSGAATSGSGSATSGSSMTGSSTTSGSSGGAMSTASGSSGNFLTEQKPGQWLASKLIGTTVVSANNESIGDVNDVVMEHDGKVAAVVIGVGGFLGIGEKNVAVPFSQIELTSRDTANAARPAGSGATTSATAPAGTAGIGAAGGAGGAGMAGGAGTAGTATTSGTGAGANTAANPDRVLLRMTKADLQNAPTFHNASRAGTATGSRNTGGATGTGSSTTNKQ